MTPAQLLNIAPDPSLGTHLTQIIQHGPRGIAGDDFVKPRHYSPGTGSNSIIEPSAIVARNR